MAYLGKLWGVSVFYQNTHSGLKLQHKGACTNHVDSKGGGGLTKFPRLSMQGGGGGWDHVYVVFFPYNFMK